MAIGLRAFVASLVALLLAVGGPAAAADRLVLGKLIVVKDPAAAEDGRTVIGLGRETGTDVPAISDPTTAGATLTVIANGGTSSSQTYTLDAAGWSALGTVGYRYAGPTGADGDPVRRLIAKRTAGGVALIKVLLRGNVGTQPLAVVPPNPGDDGGFILDVAGGDRYCVRLGGAAGGTEKQDSATAWRVVRATGETGCPTPPSTTSTSATTTSSTSSTTTSTLPPGCGNGQLDPGEQCDGGPSELCYEALGQGCFPPGSPDECSCCDTQGDACVQSLGSIPCCDPDTHCVQTGSFSGACVPNSCVDSSECPPVLGPAPDFACVGGHCCLGPGGVCAFGAPCCPPFTCFPGGFCDLALP